MRLLLILVPLLLLPVGVPAQQPDAPAAEANAAALAALRAEIAKERTAHLTYDADLLVGLFTDDFISIDGGRIIRPTREETRARFRRYFDAVVFRAWDDVAPPVITMSPDGRLATVVIHKLVRAVDRAAADNPAAEVTETCFAWLETWRREGGQWRLAQVVSTRADINPLGPGCGVRPDR